MVDQGARAPAALWNGGKAPCSRRFLLLCREPAPDLDRGAGANFGAALGRSCAYPGCNLLQARMKGLGCQYNFGDHMAPQKFLSRKI